MNNIEYVLTNCLNKRNRIRIWMGNTDTGKEWLEEHEVIGYVGKSTGLKPVFLLVYNKRSTGGGSILMDHILKIADTKTGETLYEHGKHKKPVFSISSKPEHLANGLNFAVLTEGNVHARFMQQRQAENWCEFMLGHRFSR